MLWIEGRSTAWCYLSEIELFPNAEPDAPPKPGKAVKKDDIEARADEIRKKVLGFKPVQLPTREVKGEQGEKHYFIPISPIDTIEIVDHRKRKSSMPTDILMTLLIIGLFAGGLYGGRSLFLDKEQAPSSVVRSVTKDEHAAKTTRPLNSQPLAIVTPVDSTLLEDLNKPKLTSRKSFDSNRQSKRITRINTLSTQTVATDEQSDSQAVVNNEPDTKKNEGELIKEVKPVSISSDDIAKDDTQEKKGLFKKIFGKKKKNEREEN